MKMLEALRIIFFGSPDEPKTFATATTADELIAQRVVTLIKSNFEEWKLEHFQKRDDWEKRFPNWPRVNFYAVDTLLSKGDLHLVFRDRSYARNETSGDTFALNGVPLDEGAGNVIFQAFDEIKSMTARQRSEQERIKREQEILNEKWDLAENVLGLERTALGALQPKGGFTQ